MMEEKSLISDPEVKIIIQNSDDLRKAVNELEVNSKEKEMSATELTGKIVEYKKLVNKKRKELTDPLEKIKKMFISEANSIIEPLTKLEKILRDKNIAYHNYLEDQAEKERIKHEKKMEKAIENNKPMPVEKPVEVEKNVKSESSTMSYKKTWTFTITDASKLPAEYLVPDVVKIRKMVQAGIRDIPGIRIYEETGSSLRNR